MPTGRSGMGFYAIPPDFNGRQTGGGWRLMRGLNLRSRTTGRQSRRKSRRQPGLPLPPGVLEPAHRTARAREDIGDLAQAVLVGLDAGGNRLSRVRAHNHERGHVNLPDGLLPPSGNFQIDVACCLPGTGHISEEMWNQTRGSTIISRSPQQALFGASGIHAVVSAPPKGRRRRACANRTHRKESHPAAALGRRAQERPAVAYAGAASNRAARSIRSIFR
jgi:hypothetical protein